MFGLGFGISKFRNWGTGTIGPTSTVYVDQVLGSDSYDGSGPLSAKATIGAIPLQDGMLIMLARGSVWHEELNTAAYTDVTIDAYGTGQIPVLDASDTAPASWVVDVTYPNVYNQTLPHEAGAGLYLSLWEDGVRPKWVASKALCDATPGTFFVELSAIGSNEFSVHPSDGGDPNSNGKVYTYSARNYGVYLGENSTISYVRTRKQIHNNGSFILDPNSVANFCIAEDGVKHNMFLGRGSIANDCIAWKSDWVIRDNHTAFVAFEAAVESGEVTFNRCISLMELEVLEDALSRGTGSVGFYAHTDGALGHLWSNITFNQCVTKNNTNGFAVADTVLLTATRCHAETCDEGFAFGAATNNIIDPWVNETDGIRVIRAMTFNAPDGVANIDGARIYTIASGNGLYYDVETSGTLNLTNSILYKDSDDTYAFVIYSTGGRTINSSGNIIYGGQDLGDSSAMVAFVPGVIDDNLYAGSINLDYTIEGNDFINFADYRAAYPSLDPNSQALAFGVDPGIVDPANGDFNLEPDSIAFMQGVGLDRPNAVYTAIPTHLEVAAM